MSTRKSAINRRENKKFARYLSRIVALLLILLMAFPAGVFASPAPAAEDLAPLDEQALAPSATEEESPAGVDEAPAAAAAPAVAVEQAPPATEDPAAGIEAAMVVIDPGYRQVANWTEFLAAWRDPTTTVIALLNDIQHPSGTAAAQRLSNGTANRRTQSITIVGQDAVHTIDFGTDTNADNSFRLGNATAATPQTLVLNNVKIAHAGTAAASSVVYSDTSAANAIGWTVYLYNVGTAGATTPSPLATQTNQGFTVIFAGTIDWKSTTTSRVVYARDLRVEQGSAALANAVSSSSTAVVEVLESVLTNENVTLSITGRVGIRTPVSKVENKVLFGANNNISITAVNESIETVTLAFSAGTVATIATSTSTILSNIPAISLRPNKSNVPASLTVDGANVTVSAVSGNVIWLDACASDGTGNARGISGASAQISIVNGARLTVTGKGTGGGAGDGAIAIVGNGGGINVASGSVLDVRSTHPTAGYPAVLLQVKDGALTVDGAGTQLLLSQIDPYNGTAPVLYFRYGAAQGISVSNQAEAQIVRSAYPSGYAAATVRFGESDGNYLSVLDGGQVYISNGGRGAADTSTDTMGGNEAIEAEGNGFVFSVTGTGSKATIIADKGPAIDAGSHTNDAITIGPGATFLASGNTGNTTHPVIKATGASFTFKLDSPLYYNIVNTRQGGGRILSVSTATGTTATLNVQNTNLAVWRTGVNAVSADPGATFAGITFSLSGANLATVSSDATPEFSAYYQQGASYQVNNYTRISGDNAQTNTAPVISVFSPFGIPVDASNFDPEAKLASVISLLRGSVTAVDLEDGNIGDSIEIYLDDAVDFSRGGVWVVNYSVTDSDNNTVTAQSVLVVDDGTYAYSPSSPYIVHAKSFVVLGARPLAAQSIGVANALLDPIAAQAEAQAWSAITGEPATPVVEVGDSPYVDGIETHTIKVSVDGDNSPDPAVRNVVYKVVYSDNIATGEDAILVANGVRLNNYDELGISDDALLQAAGARAFIRDDVLTPATPFVAGYTGTRTGLSGFYELAVVVQEDPSLNLVLDVGVYPAPAPLLTVETPTIIPHGNNGSPFDYMQGVAVVDAVLGDITNEVTVTWTGEVDVYTPGRYVVTYSILDFFNNPIFAEREVFVQFIPYYPEYILSARSFVIPSSSVSPGAAAVPQVLALSDPRIWDASGNLPVGLSPVVLNLGGYSSTPGVYEITLGISDGQTVLPTAPTVTIYAIVLGLYYAN